MRQKVFQPLFAFILKPYENMVGLLYMKKYYCLTFLTFSPIHFIESIFF